MFGKRYIAIAVSIFAIGVVFGVKVFNVDTFSLCAIFSVIALLSLCAFVYFSRARKEFNVKKILAATFAVAAFSFGVLRVSIYNYAASSYEQYDYKDDTATFEIIEIKENSLELKAISSDIGVNNGENLLLYTDYEFETLVAGDEIVADVTYKAQDGEKYFSNGIALTASGKVIKVKHGDGLFCNIRRFVSESAEKLYEDFEYADSISKAVVAGDKSDIDSYLYSVYNSGGVSHILAISGLHVTLIAMCLHRLLLLLSFSKRTSSVISGVIVLMYAAFVGFTPSVTRASIMILAIMASKVFLKRADSITVLFIALGALLLINPYSLFSVSLELSFLASLAILVTEPILDRIYEFFKIKGELSENNLVNFLYSALNAVIAPALMSLSTTVFSFIVILTTFDSVSYISPLVNIIVVPIFSYALAFAFIAFLLASFAMPIAEVVAAPAGYAFDFITDISEWIYKSDIGKISSHVDWIIIPCIFSVAMIISLLFLHKNRLKVFTISSIAFCVSIAVCGVLNNISQFGLTLIEYGELGGEYVFFRNEETSVYFDIGGYTSEPTVIYENGYTSVEKYVLTNYNDYSYKNFCFFSGRTSISQVILPKPKKIYEIDIYNEIILLANERNYDIIEFDEAFEYKVNDVEMTFIIDDMLGGSLLSIMDANDSVNIFLDGFPVAGHCDVAIFNGFSDEYLLNASYNDVYFKGESVANSSYDGYVDTFSDRIRIVLKDGESGRKIYEP